ncbi:MAG: DNA alkylation repair protein [Magnetococcales bacterium]|nr:DNA alkylation repair protein [Magnetococcales bacterium]
MPNGAAQPLKEIFDRPLVEALAARVAAVYPGFAAEAMVAAVLTDFAGLALMARVGRIAEGLQTFLPPHFPAAVVILLAALGEDDGSGGVEGHAGFRYLPLLHFVGRYGLAHPQLALDALAEMTRYFSAEFAIRPYILHHPELTLPRLQQWAEDADWRLRRLASEGSRPRLPWGVRLQPFIDNPEVCLAIIEPLFAESHPVVRRSVANHLNDVAKDHPKRVLTTARRWLAQGDANSRWMVRHALRTLIKQGDGDALALLGFSGSQPPEVVAFSLGPAEVKLGEAVTFTATLRCRQPARLCIDYRIHHQRHNGTLSPKVFKLSTRQVVADTLVQLEKHHTLRLITTRRYYPGEHRLELLVNGTILCGGSFVLVMPCERQ